MSGNKGHRVTWENRQETIVDGGQFYGSGRLIPWVEVRLDGLDYTKTFSGFEQVAKLQPALSAEQANRDKRNAAARAKRQAYKDQGMTRVRGALGGIYCE